MDLYGICIVYESKFRKFPHKTTGARQVYLQGPDGCAGAEISINTVELD